jgi:hypothetical protein
MGLEPPRVTWVELVAPNEDTPEPKKLAEQTGEIIARHASIVATCEAGRFVEAWEK